MTINVLFSAQDVRWEEYRAPLAKAFSGANLGVDLSRNHSPADVDYIVFAPNGPVTDFRPYAKTKAVLSLWAGIETVVNNATLTQPLVRMVDPGLTQGMIEWVAGHTLRHHLGMDAHILGQDGVWRTKVPPLAADRRVAILGLGALGSACARTLKEIGFDVVGWSRSLKEVPEIHCHHGDVGLQTVLKTAQIVILLLPQTPETTNILNAERLALLPKGAVIINPGRGPLIDDDALLTALDSGKVGHATLDVFRVEPLPAEHRFWSHPSVTVTPHIASATRPESAATTIAENIARSEAGRPMLNVVDRKLGY